MRFLLKMRILGDGDVTEGLVYEVCDDKISRLILTGTHECWVWTNATESLKADIFIFEEHTATIDGYSW